ncbi:hypothetical protein TWF694_011609 [Orbilia ellipsospora]|uniref:Amino acid transporter n=1 Tax=Orbilia ellipsospora TaxID=2528407 RepID=A0AAV9X5P9_9PEZI
MLALVFADYFCGALGLQHAESIVIRKTLAISAILFVAIVNGTGNKQSHIVTKIFLVCKLFGLGFVIIVGLGSAAFPQKSAPTLLQEQNVELTIGNYADAVLTAMWAYSGWETLSYVAGEVINPQKNTSIVINTSMAIVILLFMLANVAYFSALTFADIIKSMTTGLTFSEHFLGNAGTLLYAVLICLSSVGSLNVKTFTASRLTQAAVDRGFLPRIFKTVASSPGNTHDPRGGTTRPMLLSLANRSLQYKDGSVPLSSIIFNSLLGVLYVIMGEFSTLVTFIGIIEYTMVFFTLIGLFFIDQKSIQNMEITEQDATLKVNRWLVVVACVTTALMVLSSLSRHPFAGIAVIFFLVAGTISYNFIIRPKTDLDGTVP